jgi:hypothetical protein
MSRTERPLKINQENEYTRSVLMYIGLDKNRTGGVEREEFLKEKVGEKIKKAGLQLDESFTPMEYGSLIRRHVERNRERQRERQTVQKGSNLLEVIAEIDEKAKNYIVFELKPLWTSVRKREQSLRRLRIFMVFMETRLLQRQPKALTRMGP